MFTLNIALLLVFFAATAGCFSVLVWVICTHALRRHEAYTDRQLENLAEQINTVRGVLLDLLDHLNKLEG